VHFYDFAIDKNALRDFVLFTPTGQGYPLMGRIEKTFSKWGS